MLIIIKNDKLIFIFKAPNENQYSVRLILN